MNLVCSECNSSASEELWKLSDEPDVLLCPVCGAAKKTNTEDVVVEEQLSLIESASSRIDSVLGIVADRCPNCGHVICVCSLKGVFK